MRTRMLTNLRTAIFAVSSPTIGKKKISYLNLLDRSIGRGSMEILTQGTGKCFSYRIPPPPPRNIALLPP